MKLKKIYVNLLSKVVLILLAYGGFSHPLFAMEPPKSVIDLYRSNQITAEYIREKFGSDFDKLSDLLSSPNKLNSPQSSAISSTVVREVTQDINQHGKFVYVSISPIKYPERKTIYYTIDVVDKKDQARLRGFLKKPTQTIPDPGHLIHNWLEYEKLSFAVMFNKNQKIIIKKCPAFHCLFGFEQPQFKKYEKIFNEGVPKYKSQLINILRNDKDEIKRAAAAFLLAHIHDGNELVKILAPSIWDSSEHVRNNVMRTLGETLVKVKTTDFPIQDAVAALDFPKETDRNKALFIILSAIDQPMYAQYVIANASKQIIDELKMSQPNLHETAYAILSKLSHQKFDEYDYQAWSKWLSEHKG